MGDISSILCYTISGEGGIMETIAFFGHRTVLNKEKIKVKITNILKELNCKNPIRCLVGCHGEFDDIALQACLEYKNTINSNLIISVVLTSLTFLNKQEYGYSRADYYNDRGCETVFYDLEEVYYKKRITYTNKKMVNDSDLIICYVKKIPIKALQKRQ